MRTRRMLAVAASALAMASCAGGPPRSAPTPEAQGPSSHGESNTGGPTERGTPARSPAAGPQGVVTVGFAGDVHFEGPLEPLVSGSGGALGPIESSLRQPDLMVVNLETAISERGTPEPKAYQFRAPPLALDVLAAAGVDLVSLANNHAADYGAVGLADTLAALRDSPIPAIGIGANVREAFRPHRVSIRGTRLAFFAVTTKADRTANAWAAETGKPGVAVAVRPRPRLLRAVSRASTRADVVVVYLHWGIEKAPCPSRSQIAHANTLSAAGADVVLGTHAHVLQGAGWLGDTYVGYGLGNFLWYNQGSIDTGILELTIRGGEVVGDAWRPAHIQADGLPVPLLGSERAAEIADWRQLRACTGLAETPSD